MLGLDELKSAAVRDRVHKGVLGLRPGWVRVNFHYMMTDEECDFLISAIRFVADHGHEFLPLYSFDVCTGSWTIRDAERPESAVSGGAGTAHTAHGRPESAVSGAAFGLDEAYRTGVAGEGASVEIAAVDVHEAYLREARRLLEDVRKTHPHPKMRSTLRDLIPFVYCSK